MARDNRNDLARTVRRLSRGQTALWTRFLADLQPWQQEGELRWRGRNLDGSVLPPEPAGS